MIDKILKRELLRNENYIKDAKEFEATIKAKERKGMGDISK